jgi:hypothetical protein
MAATTLTHTIPSRAVHRPGAWCPGGGMLLFADLGYGLTRLETRDA